jgi:hypothetical protein
VMGGVDNCALGGEVGTWGAGIGVAPDETCSGKGRRERVILGVGCFEDRPEDKGNNS